MTEKKIKIRVLTKSKKKKDIGRGYIVPSRAIPITYAVPEKPVYDRTYEEAVPEEEKPTQTTGGIKIPDIENVDIIKISDIEESELMKIDIKYPLIPQVPKRGERIFAYTHIYWDPKNNELVYLVIEPRLTEDDKKLLTEIREYIEEKIDINFSYVRKKEAVNYIMNMFDQALDYFGIERGTEFRNTLRYYILKDFIGLEDIEPLLKDERIEDISCDGVNVPLYVYHRDPRFGSMRTNIKFTTGDNLDSFVTKLSERCGKSISMAEPLLDGTLPDGSRVQATLGTDIARYGSNFTIRKFTQKPLTPVDIIEFNTADMKTMSLFWFIVEHGSSILVSGGTATGKTSLLNVLSLFIKPQMKIVSIEDTAELRLPHSHWIPEVARVPIAERGKIDLYELLRTSLRQRPDYILVGEVRGKEAFVLFQQIAIGHPGLSTIHAENFPKLMDRLTTSPISLQPNLIANLDLILFLKRIKQKGRYLRRLSSAIEVVGFDRKTNTPIINEIVRWDPKTDTYKIMNKSVVLKKIADMTGMGESDIQEDIRKRSEILEWMVKNKIKDYRHVGRIINLFYTSPDFLLGRIEAGI